MIHSDSHQINAHWHGLPRQARAKSFKYRHKCILMPRSVSLFPLASHFHITYLVSLINFVLRLCSLAIQHTRHYLSGRSSRIALSHDLGSFLFLYLASSPSRSPSRFSVSISTSRRAFFPLSNRNSMLRVNIMESPRILGGFFFAVQGSKQISKWHNK